MMQLHCWCADWYIRRTEVLGGCHQAELWLHWTIFRFLMDCPEIVDQYLVSRWSRSRIIALVSVAIHEKHCVWAKFVIYISVGENQHSCRCSYFVHASTCLDLMGSRWCSHQVSFRNTCKLETNNCVLL
jgi:hypothetical protein